MLGYNLYNYKMYMCIWGMGLCNPPETQPGMCESNMWGSEELLKNSENVPLV